MGLFAILFLILQGADPSGRGPLRIQGQVTDPSGALLPGVSVSVRSDKGNLPRITVTDESGRYTLSGILAGKYQLIAELPGFASNRTTVDMDASMNVNLTLQLILMSSGPGVSADRVLAPTIEAEVRERQLKAERLVAQLRQYSMRMESLSQTSILKELHALGTDAVPSLILALRDRDVQVRRNAAFALFDLSSDTPIGDRPGVDIREALPALNSALQDADSMVREWSALALVSAARK